ncbi:proline-rich protein 23C-like [Pipistrellus kuhlii]|uniref:proline-rich protein 23C-like n=1 Tax=Pipistrellus kuhlii TaxID=59472 RepID=UPI00174EDE16|nr:proline-rich protein 23C-like [Pipistrellus kuhlii]
MLGRRPLSPSFHAAPRWEPQPGGPGPAKRRRIQGPAGPEHGMAPGLQGPAEPRAAAALTSVVVLAAGCALQLPLDSGVDLMLEPAPTSVLRVRLGRHTLVLVPEALWGAGAGARSPGGPEPVAVQQGFFCAFVPEIVAAPEIAVPEVAVPEMAVPEMAVPEISVPEMAVPKIAVPEMAFPEVAFPEEAYDGNEDEDAAPGFLTPWMAAGTGLGTHPHGPIKAPWPQAPTPSPERRTPGPYYSLDSHLWEPFPSSALQPLPPSPSLGPQVRPRRPLGPPPKARRRLFRE